MPDKFESGIFTLKMQHAHTEMPSLNFQLHALKESVLKNFWFQNVVSSH